MFHFVIDLNWSKIFYFFFLYYWNNIGVQLFPRPTSLHWSCFSRLGQGANSTHGEWKTFDWSSCQLFTQIDRAHRSSHTVGYVIRIITQMQSGPMIPFFLHLNHSQKKINKSRKSRIYVVIQKINCRPWLTGISLWILYNTCMFYFTEYTSISDHCFLRL